jgi:hypothetical protein
LELALVIANVAVAIGTMVLAFATYRLARSAQVLVHTAEQQMQVSRQQAKVSQSQMLEQYRPLLEPRSAFKDGYPFVVRNIGTGVAFNVHFLYAAESELSGPDAEIGLMQVSIAPGEFAEHAQFERQPQSGTHLIISCDDIWGQEHVADFAYYGGSQAWRRLAPATDDIDVTD